MPEEPLLWLQYTSCSFPGSSYGSRVRLSFFMFLLLVSAALLKVWCKVKSIDCLIYSHHVRRPWAVKLQNRSWGYAAASKTVIEHPVCAGSSLSPCTGGVRSELQNTYTDTNGSIKLDLTEKLLHSLKKDFWKLNSCSGLVVAIVKDVLPQFESVLGITAEL